MMKFLCPNGHSLTAPENLAGKSGKCPKCNASFIVPRPDEVGDSANLVAASGSTVTPAMGSGMNLAAGGEIFVFLCPNGHKLNGPPSLKGKPGQCPHCGARFLIPTDEDIEAASAESPAEDSEEEDQLPADTAIEGQGIDFNRLLGSGGNDGAREGEDVKVMRPPAGPSGLGFIVARLWERRTEASELEIFLSEGEIVAPDFYSESLSTSDYGVFAVQEGDGSFAVTVIPWNTVRRVGLRRMGKLPGELFQ
jgi:hypothetical protein